MPPVSHPLRFLLIALAGWIHQQQRDVIDYLRAENRVLREQLAPNFRQAQGGKFCAPSL